MTPSSSPTAWRGPAVTAAILAALALGWRGTRSELQYRLQDANMMGLSASPPASPFTWCDLETDGTVRIHLPKIEIGQGVHTALAQVFADELGVAWEQLQVTQAGSDRGFPASLVGAGGSTTVASMYPMLRAAAATIRETVRLEAARQWRCSPHHVEISGGVAHAGDRSARLGEIAAARTGPWPEVDGPVALRSTGTGLIGSALPRVDLPDKVTGAAVFAGDVRLPRMAYGAVARPPRYGARIAGVSGTGAVRALPGVVDVVVRRNIVGVVAERPSQARRALAQLEVHWRGGSRLSQPDLLRRVTLQPTIRGGPVQRVGNADEVLEHDPDVSIHQAHYRTNVVLPLPLEPPTAVADVRPDRVVLHAATQVPFMKAAQLAVALRRWPGAIDVVTPFVGGSFGRKVADTAATEAALLSDAVRRPVQVAWTTAEELAFSRRRPPTHHRLRAATRSGRVLAVEHRVASAGGMHSIPIVRTISHLTRMDGSDTAGAANPYSAIPHRSAHYQFAPVTELPLGGFRAYGFPTNIFAAECFLDELAHRAGVDPLRYRLDHLGDGLQDQRLARVLGAAADEAGWQEGAPRGRALGIAAGREVAGTIVAAVAEVSVQDGRIRVHRVTQAVDAGLIVNPNGARAQVEGATMMALSWALIEDSTVVDGMATQRALADYPMLAARDAPEITVRFVSDPSAPPAGLGEPPIGPPAAAVANAVFAATGRRLRELPLDVR
jgi:isoquinoline 1-oxidoreductase beta subunit